MMHEGQAVERADPGPVQVPDEISFELLPVTAAPPARMALMTFDVAADAHVACAARRAGHSEHLPSGSPPDLVGSLSRSDFLVAFIADEATCESASATLRDARQRGVLTFAFCPPPLHEAFAPWADVVGEWAGPADSSSPFSSENLVICMDAIAQMMRERGLVCVDYQDVRCIVHGGGPATVVVTSTEGADRAQRAVRELAARCEALGIGPSTYGRALVSVRADPRMRLEEFTAVASGVEELLGGLDISVAAARSDPERRALEVTVLLTGRPEPQRATPFELLALVRRAKDSPNVKSNDDDID